VDKIKLEILGLSSSQSQSGSFALVLGETEGNRRLPIIIGMFEAQAIAIEIEKIVPNRPMTHDLFKSFAHGYGFKVTEIIISDLKEGVFFAKVVCEGPSGTVEIDARPSDAIAIGLRFDAEIYSYETILSEAGIVLSDEIEEDITEIKSQIDIEKVESVTISDPMKDDSIEKLNQLLNKAIENEDYERAAQIRDELSRRN
jgi:bifunctional DNase/RNase